MKAITINSDGSGQGTSDGSWVNTNLSGVCSVSISGATLDQYDAPLPDFQSGLFTCGTPKIKLVKKTNGVYTPGLNDGNAPQVAAGATVSWTYDVTNTGGLALSSISVTDSKGVQLTCPRTSLAVNETMQCTASGTAVDVSKDPTSKAGNCPAGGGLLYENVATVTGTATDETTVTDTSVSHYCNPAKPSLSLKKYTFGGNSPAAPGADTSSPTDGYAPQIAAGQPVTWNYVVTNTGNLAISNIALIDTKIGSITCPSTSLAVGASLTCTKSGTAVAVYQSPDTTGVCGGAPGLPMYENGATVTGKASDGTNLNASYKSHYCNPPGPAYTLKKLTNGVDTPSPSDGKAPQVAIGATVTWSYIVTNTGSVPLYNIGISDDKLNPNFVCTVQTLAVGKSAQCDKTGPAQSTVGSQVLGVCGGVPNTPMYENTATSSVTVNGAPIALQYKSHYCVPQGKSFTIPTDPTKLSSMEGAISIMPGDWVSGGVSFKFKNGSHAATNYTVQAWVDVPVTCKNGGGAGGTISIPLGAPGTGANAPVVTYSIPANNTDWLPTGDANSINSWQGSVQAPALCGTQPMDASKGARLRSTVLQSPSTGSLVDWRFKYRDPNAKGKGNVNCLDATNPARAKADVCGASWSGTVTDP
jgi:uncharacterized repeat protein (TIGR01451 family)